MKTSADHFYTSGEYYEKHSEWGLPEAPMKAVDLTPGLIELLRYLPDKRLRIGEIGAGAGQVLHEVMKVVHDLDPGIQIEPVGFEISQQAVDAAAHFFPSLPMKCQYFTSADGPFDVVLLIDVLEHLENPWEMLRTARAASRFMLVRQPLLANFSTFRRDNYEEQRSHWGHIALFNYRSFLDMAKSTGWVARKIDLVAPWELTRPDTPGGFPQKLICRWNRTFASYLLAGFYLNGLFERA